MIPVFDGIVVAPLDGIVAAVADSKESLDPESAKLKLAAEA